MVVADSPVAVLAVAVAVAGKATKAPSYKTFLKIAREFRGLFLNFLKHNRIDFFGFL